MCFLCKYERDRRLAKESGVIESTFYSLSIAPHELIDNEMVSYTKRAIATDGVLDYYLHSPGGAVTVAGGIFGEQLIESFAIPSVDQDYFRSVVHRLDAIIDLDFLESSSASGADVDLFYDSNIDLGGADVTLGLALTDGLDGWELFVNYPEVEFDDNYRRYVLIHEFGHALGLEHPFENGDGDSVNGITNPWSSSFPEETVMAYRQPQLSSWPEFFTDNDLNALMQVWGRETTLSVPTSVFSEPELSGVTFNLLSTQNDVLVGSDQVDWINGGRGSDQISGAAGNDFLRGGKDDDFLNGNIGNDLIYGDLGNDKVRGGKGDDNVNGNKGKDWIYGDLGNDLLRGGKNDDWINGGPGDDQIWGDLGADRISLSPGNDLVWGFSPADGDRVEIEEGIHYILGSAGDNLQIRTDVGTTTLVGIKLGLFQSDWLLTV